MKAHNREFPDWLDAFMHYTEKVEAPDKFLLWSGISALSAVIDRKCWLHHSANTFIYPNMYIILVAPSGLRKTASSQQAMSLIREVKSVKMLSSQMTEAAIMEAFKKAGQGRFVHINGKKYNNSSLFLYMPELAASIKRNDKAQGAVVEQFTDLWDCIPQGWHQEGGPCMSKETKSEGIIRVYNPCMSMLGCSTPEWLLKSIGHDEIKGGFASRMLFIVHKGKIGREISYKDSKKGASQELRNRVLDDLKHIARLCGQFKESDGYMEAYEMTKKLNDDFIAHNPQDMFSGYRSRKLWHISKLAMILSVSESDRLELQQRHWIKAMKLVESLETDMILAFEGTAKNEDAWGVRNIWDFARRREYITKRILIAHFINDIPRDQINKCIMYLIDLGRIKETYNKDGSRELRYYIKDSTPI